jgi:hypothetical protein
MALTWVCRRYLFTVDRQDMNPRSLSEKIDDGVMGEIAAVAVMQFLADHGRHVIAYDQVRTDQYKDPDPGWDILSSHISFDDWKNTSEDFKIKPENAHSFSIKSSRIPEADQDNIDLAISRRDFKIFKRSVSIDLDITADFEVQVYFLLQASKFDRSFTIAADQLKNDDIDAMIVSLSLMERYGECLLSGAASKSTLVAYSNTLPPDKRSWNSNHAGYNKPMWSAPLTLGRSFETLNP